MPDEIDFSVTMSWNDSCGIDDSGEPFDYIDEIQGRLFAFDKNCRRRLIGKFRVYYVDIERAIEAQESPFYVFDSYSGTEGYYGVFFDSKSLDFRSCLRKQFNEDIYGRNVLIIDRMEILPKYRGRGVGLNAMRKIMIRFGRGAGIVALKAFPLQFEPEPNGEEEKKRRKELALDKFPKNQDVAVKKLMEYYERLGFCRIGRTLYMAWSTVHELPDIPNIT